MAELMRTMAYEPSKLCGTDPTVWAVDGTSAIGISTIRSGVYGTQWRALKAYDWIVCG